MQIEVTRSIRPFARNDIPQVADLFWRVFLKPDPDLSQVCTVQDVCVQFTEIFFNHPWHNDTLTSLVYEGKDGKILGFLGVTPRWFWFRDQPVLAAVSVHFMVEPGQQSALAGVQLLKSFLSGPQDLSFTDGANLVGRQVWEGIGGAVVPLYSMSWLRPLRPTQYAISLVEKKYSWLALFRPVSRVICRLSDAVLTRAFKRYQITPPSLEAAEPDTETLRACITRVSATDLLRPEYDSQVFEWLMHRAADITRPGKLQKVICRNSSGVVQGWYLYYLKPDGVSEVIQIKALKTAVEKVLDHLCLHAYSHGATAITGRLDHKFMQALSKNNCLINFGNQWFLMHARDPAILQAVYQGDAFITPLDGEWCTSFRL